MPLVNCLLEFCAVVLDLRFLTQRRDPLRVDALPLLLEQLIANLLTLALGDGIRFVEFGHLHDERRVFAFNDPGGFPRVEAKDGSCEGRLAAEAFHRVGLKSDV